jgi:hypothetical protein
MVAKPTTPEIQALISRSRAARVNLGIVADDLRAKLDAPARVRESMRSHPTRWLAGATATGLITSRLLFRRPRASRAKKPKSFLLFILQMISNAAMPAVKIWLLAQIKAYLSRRTTGPQPPLSF